jgi:ADP-ribose pyrophosphatase YjhB (NUDIX family)
LRSSIATRLDTFTPHVLSPEELRRAAVVIAVVAGAHGQAACLLTRRPETIKRHAGQLALPGGRVDPGESEADAALCELHAPTGAILCQFREVALAGRHTRVGHFARPRFSWQ